MECYSHEILHIFKNFYVNVLKNKKFQGLASCIPIHTKSNQTTLFASFAEMYPQKQICNKQCNIAICDATTVCLNMW